MIYYKLIQLKKIIIEIASVVFSFYFDSKIPFLIFKTFLFLDVDECAQNPCSNGGVCQNMDGTYHCDCPASLVGKDCTASKNTTLFNTKYCNLVNLDTVNKHYQRI